MEDAEKQKIVEKKKTEDINQWYDAKDSGNIWGFLGFLAFGLLLL